MVPHPIQRSAKRISGDGSMQVAIDHILHLVAGEQVGQFG